MQEYLTPDMINAVLLFVALVVMFVIQRVGYAVRDNERMKKVILAWQLIDDNIIDLVFFVAAGDVDFESFEDEATDKDMDIRMWWVIQNAEKLAASYLGYEPDFIELHTRAERIFQELRADEETIV